MYSNRASQEAERGKQREKKKQARKKGRKKEKEKKKKKKKAGVSRSRAGVGRLIGLGLGDELDRQELMHSTVLVQYSTVNAYTQCRMHGEALDASRLEYGKVQYGRSCKYSTRGMRRTEKKERKVLLLAQSPSSPGRSGKERKVSSLLRRRHPSHRYRYHRDRYRKGRREEVSLDS